MQQEPMTLNQGQSDAADAFFKFLFSKDTEIIISGPGGVGNTFLMGHLIDEIMPRYQSTCKLMGIPAEYDQVVMTATTNKAAEVLSLSTGRPTETIHSFMNLKVTDDFETGESRITKTGNWQVHFRQIIFIDECSMIDSNLRNLLLEGTQSCKIIYVGDHCQLAPIKEPISPIYRSDLVFRELTEPMRNADQPALMNLCQQLRETVETKEFYPIQLVPGVIDLLEDEEMEAEIFNHFQTQTTTSRILAYTNRRVIDLNNYIRGIRGLGSSYKQGEMLINNSAIRMKTGMLSVEDEIEITHQSQHTEMLCIQGDIELQVRYSDLRTSRGELYTNVPVPEDREHFLALIKWFQKQKNWNRYFHLKNTYPDLRPRDAATVHKAQGSTYDTVFIDLGNISTCHNPDLVARMLYVAVSRAKTRVIFFGELAAKYGGVI